MPSKRKLTRYEIESPSKRAKTSTKNAEPSTTHKTVSGSESDEDIPTTSLIEEELNKVNSMESNDPLVNLTIMLYVMEQDQMLSDFASEIAFQGFNPLQLREKLLKKCLSSGASVIDHYKNISKICVLYLTRGTILSTIKNRTEANGIMKINSLERLYDIKDGGRAAEIVSVGRIVSSHPEITAAVLLSLPLRNPEFRTKLPHCLRFAGACSIIPKADEELLAAHREYCKEFDELINPKATVDAKLMGFWKAAHKSNIHSETARYTILRNCAVKTNEKGLHREDMINLLPKYPSRGN